MKFYFVDEVLISWEETTGLILLPFYSFIFYFYLTNWFLSNKQLFCLTEDAPDEHKY